MRDNRPAEDIRMAKKQLRLGCSPLTGTIFAGTLLKDGRTWSADKQDVTMEAVGSVVEHCLHNGGSVTVGRSDGLMVYELSVKQSYGTPE